MILALNTAAIPKATLEEAVQATIAAGFKGLEPRISLLINRDPWPSKARPFKWFPLNSLEGLFALPLDELEMCAKNIFLLAQRHGIPAVISVPGAVSHLDLEDALFVLSSLKRLAAAYKVELMYEMLGFPGHAFPDLQKTLKLVRKVGIRLVLDTFHLAISRAKLQEISKIPGPLIGLVHLSDAIAEGKALEELTDEDRVLPGEGSLPLSDILAAIRETGFEGGISVEVFHPRYSLMDPYTVARDAFKRARVVLEEAGW